MQSFRVQSSARKRAEGEPVANRNPIAASNYLRKKKVLRTSRQFAAG
jgi:hypothetical protein